MALAWEIRSTTSSGRPATRAASSSGARGHVPSEWGKSDSQQTLSTLSSSSSFTPMGSLMKQQRMWRLKTSVGPA